MKIVLSFLLLTIQLAGNAFHNNRHKPEHIVGIWLNSEKQNAIRVYKVAGKYHARMYSMKKKIPGLEEGDLVIKDLEHIADNNYGNGQAFVHRFGWINCSAKLVNHNTLAITGTKSMVTRTRTFSRVK